MKSALSLTLAVSLVASALPLTAQEQMEGPGSFDLRDPATHRRFPGSRRDARGRPTHRHNW
jgi:hypothetical protein